LVSSGFQRHPENLGKGARFKYRRMKVLIHEKQSLKVASGMSGSPQTVSNRPFPLDVVAVSDQWAIVVRLEDGSAWHLLKPGWTEDRQAPYVFSSPEEAWGFLRRTFLFCLKQRHSQYLQTDKIMNCEHCGRIMRARFFRYCFECLQENEQALHQVWQGFYYLTGSQEATLHKLSMLLRIPPEQLTTLPDAFGRLVRHNMALADELRLLSHRNEQPNKKPAGMHSNRIR
jgi:hypothetical protein